MTSFADAHQCDYLRLHSLPPAFASERAELIHINEQVTSLDAHISQLNALRADLHRRSCQLHNSLSPISVFPVEVLSYIFQQLISSEGSFGSGDSFGGNFYYYQERLARALVLSSVSSHFRRVALGTPMLWKYVPLCIPDQEAIDTASSLLQHCTSLASFVSVSVMDRIKGDMPGSPFDLLLTPDVTRKVKNFELYTFGHACVWGEKLGRSSFPLLDALGIEAAYEENPLYDFGSLKTLTRLHISNHLLSYPIIVPPSIQHLHIQAVTPQVFLSIVHQCSNIVDCRVDFDSGDNTPFAGPVRLNHFKQLSVRVREDIQTNELVERMIPPSLETLEIEYRSGNTFLRFFPLCQGFSATITTIDIKSFTETVGFNDLYQLCRLPLPKLEKLLFGFNGFQSFVNAIRALALLENELSESDTHHLPALRFVFLYLSGDMKPPSLVKLLRKWRIGEALDFHVWVEPDGTNDCSWSPYMRKKLEEVIGWRRVSITWGDSEIWERA